MVRTVSLSKHKRASVMLSSLRKMKQEEKFCDFTIRVGRYECKAHRLILAVGSPYFRAMLEHDTKESQDGEVEMKEVDFECVESCINSMYSATFDIPDGKLVDLLHVASLMQLKDVKNAICKILIEELNVENFFESRNIADVYDLQELSLKCEIHYKKNAMAISTQPGFETELKSRLVLVLNSKNLNLSEEDKLTVSFRWVGKDSGRTDDLIELIKLIRLKYISAEYLIDVLQNHPFVNTDIRLYRMLNVPLLANARIGNTRSRKDSDDAKTVVVFDMESQLLHSCDPASGEVTKFHNEIVPVKKYFSAISLDWHVYILCGNKSVHRLDCRSKTSKWERMQDLITSHGLWPPAVTLRRSLFVIAASDFETKEVDMFSPDENCWVRLKDKPRAVSGLTLVSLNSSVYCVGGTRGLNSFLKSFCRFTPATSEWIDLEPMRFPRRHCAVVAFDKKIIVMGGRTSTCRDVINAVECYDVKTGQWSMLASTKFTKSSTSGAHVINGSIYVVQRFVGCHEIEKYDIANNTWHKVEWKFTPPIEMYDCVTI